METQTSVTSCFPQYSLAPRPYLQGSQSAPTCLLSNTCLFLKCWPHGNSFLSCLKRVVSLPATAQILLSWGPPDPLSLMSTPRDAPVGPGAGIAHISTDTRHGLSLTVTCRLLSTGTVLSREHRASCLNWTVGAFRLETIKHCVLTPTMRAHVFPQQILTGW